MTILHLRMWEARSWQIRTNLHPRLDSFKMFDKYPEWRFHHFPNRFTCTAGLVFSQHTSNVRDGQDSWRTRLSLTKCNTLSLWCRVACLHNITTCLHWTHVITTKTRPWQSAFRVPCSKKKRFPLASEEIVKAIRSGAVRNKWGIVRRISNTSSWHVPEQIPDCMGAREGLIRLRYYQQMKLELQDKW